jgi:hypothetical protein
MSSNQQLDLETVFIEKVLENIPDQLYFENLLDPKNHPSTYETWLKIQNKILAEFVEGSPISCDYGKILVKEPELNALKHKIESNEFDLIKRINMLALNNAWHNNDELNDDR